MGVPQLKVIRPSQQHWPPVSLWTQGGGCLPAVVQAVEDGLGYLRWCEAAAVVCPPAYRCSTNMTFSRAHVEYLNQQ